MAAKLLHPPVSLMLQLPLPCGCSLGEKAAAGLMLMGQVAQGPQPLRSPALGPMSVFAVRQLLRLQVLALRKAGTGSHLCFLLEIREGFSGIARE